VLPLVTVTLEAEPWKIVFEVESIALALKT
jgi:hypothetical protein